MSRSYHTLRRHIHNVLNAWRPDLRQVTLIMEDWGTAFRWAIVRRPRTSGGW